VSATREPAGVAPQATPSSLQDPSTPHGQLGLAFKRAMVAVRKLRGRETHRPGQISYAQYGLLHGLAGEATGLSARELADMADLTPATVTQMLESMESGGLITRMRSEADRRVVLSTLTAKGAEIVHERRAQMEPRWRAAMDEFETEELITAAKVLNRLADYFDAMIEDPPKA
jgi:DNA-binding MarR family transcriptional regulator